MLKPKPVGNNGFVFVFHITIATRLDLCSALYLADLAINFSPIFMYDIKITTKNSHFLKSSLQIHMYTFLHNPNQPILISFTFPL